MILPEKIIYSFARHCVDMLERDAGIKCNIVKKKHLKFLPSWFPYNQYLEVDFNSKFDTSFRAGNGNTISVKKPSF